MKKFNLVVLLMGVLLVSSSALAQLPFTIHNPQYGESNVDVKEIYTRLTTEDLTDAQKVEILMGPAQKMNKAADRVQYFAQVLNPLKKYALPVSVQITLLKKAMAAAEQMPYVPSNQNGWPTPVEDLVKIISRFSADHDETNGPVAHEFLVRIFKMPGLSEQMLEKLSLQFNEWAKEKQAYPDYAFVMEHVITSSRLNEDLALHYVFEALHKFAPPYMVRSQLLVKLAESGKMPASLVPFAKQLSYKFALSAQFVAKLKAVKNDEYKWVNQKQVAIATIDANSDAPFLFGIVSAWFSESSVPTDIQSEIVSKLLTKSDAVLGQTTNNGASMASNVLGDLINFPFLGVSDSVRRDIVSFVLAHSAIATSESERFRYLLPSGFIYNFSQRKNWPLATTQFTLEQVMKTSLPGTPVTAKDPNRGNSDSTVDMVLGALETCQDPSYPGKQAGFENGFCQVLTSRSKIYQIIIDNHNIGAAQRQRAAKLKASSGGH